MESTGLIQAPFLGAAIVAGAMVVTLGIRSVSADSSVSTAAVDIASSPAAAPIQFSGMSPGDEVVAPMTVTNRGSMHLRYAMTSLTREDFLSAQLDMTVWSETAEFDLDEDCGLNPPAAVLYGPDDLGGTTGVEIFGDPSPGTQPGDRLLAPGATERLCIRVSMPLDTGNEFQGTYTEATFSLVAEQDTNTP